jgi:hypothetical protein
MSVILALEKEGWVRAKSGEPGYFVWSMDFPRQIITDFLDPDDLSKCYRNAVSILLNNAPLDDRSIPPLPGNACWRGFRKRISIHLQGRGDRGEKAQGIVGHSALRFHPGLHGAFRRPGDQPLSDNAWVTFIRAVERRASLSLFHPSLK